MYESDDYPSWPSRFKLALLFVSAIAAFLAYIALGAGQIILFWDSYLRYSLLLIGAAIALNVSRLWSYLLAISFSIGLFYIFGQGMIAEWREYYKAGAGFWYSLRHAMLPIYVPLSLVVALTIFCNASYNLLQEGEKQESP